MPTKLDENTKALIDSMSQEEMARSWRFEPAGSWLFQGEISEYFQKRFAELGGLAPAISKKIGL